MTSKPLTEPELTEILKLAREGEDKFRKMSDRATILAEKWRTKTRDIPRSM